MGELVEKVARAIRIAVLRRLRPNIPEDEIETALRTTNVDYTFEAHAAIAAVAEWLERSGSMKAAVVGNALRNELEQPE